MEIKTEQEGLLFDSGDIVKEEYTITEPNVSVQGQSSETIRFVITEVEEKNTKSSVCKICNKEFANAHRLKKHVTIHSTKRNFQCTICKATFKNKDSLQKHQRLHNTIKDVSCNICLKTYKNNSTLYAHMRSHSDEKKYKCAKCGKTFKWKSNVREHLLGVHLKLRRTYCCHKKENKCNTCGKTFSSRLNLENHLEKGYNLKSHVKKREALMRNLKYDKSKRKKNYKCGLCKKRFTLKQLKIHAETSHNQDEDRNNINLRLNNKRQEQVRNTGEMSERYIPYDLYAFKCLDCPKTYQTKFYLWKHIQEHHKSSQQMKGINKNSES